MAELIITHKDGQVHTIMLGRNYKIKVTASKLFVTTSRSSGSHTDEFFLSALKGFEVVCDDEDGFEMVME